MKILQVVTLHSPDAAYGGPLRVALNQSKALRDRGHDVELASAHRGYESAPEYEDSVPLRLFPARQLIPRVGFAGIAAPGLMRWLFHHATDYDVVHVHLARDLVSMPAAAMSLIRKSPVIAQTHGMIDPSEQRLAPLFDSTLTRPILRKAKSVCYLTDHESRMLRAVAGDGMGLTRVTNGVPSPMTGRPSNRPREVLFMARLHERKRPMTFARAAAALSPEFPDVLFTIVGPDEGEGSKLDTFIDGLPQNCRISREGPVAPNEAIDRMSAAHIYVLPSVNEPYPMSVLEALSLGIPPIVTTSCGLANDLSGSKAGLVITDNEQDLARAIRDLLVNDNKRDDMAAASRALATQEFSMEAVAERLEQIYHSSRGLKSQDLA